MLEDTIMLEIIYANIICHCLSPSTEHTVSN